MNDARRKQLRTAIALIEEAKAKLEEAKQVVEDSKSEEEEYRDNMPENMQQSERYDRAEEAVNSLDTAYDAFDQIDFEEITGAIEEAIG